MSDERDMVAFKGGDCLVCYAAFKTEGVHTPVLFTCGHSICRKCSERLPQERPGKNYSFTRVKCPSCYSYSPTPLVKNFELINILDANGGNYLLSAPTAAHASTCEHCSLSPSRIYCITCVVSLCEECDALLHRSAAMSRHSRTSVHSECPTRQSIKAQSSSLRGVRALCPNHPGEPLKILCETCHCLVCRDCVDLGPHGGHLVRLIGPAATDYRQRLVALIPQARSLVTSLRGFLASLDSSPRPPPLNTSLSPATHTDLSLTPPPGAQVPLASETDSGRGSPRLCPPSPPGRLQETATAQIRSHFAELHRELDQREADLVAEVRAQLGGRARRRTEFRECVARVIAQAESTLAAAEDLAAGDDSSVCTQYKSVAGDLEAALLAPLAEEEDTTSSGAVDLALSGDALVTDIRDHGVVGPPAVPSEVRVSLASPSLLPEEEAVTAGPGGASGRVVLSWSQPRGGAEVVRYRIQRGVCDNLPGPCLHAPSASMGASFWEVDDDDPSGCSVGPSSTPMGAYERDFDGDPLTTERRPGDEDDDEDGQVNLERREMRRGQREIGHLLLFETVGEMDARSSSSLASTGEGRDWRGVEEGGDALETEDDGEDVVSLYGKKHVLLSDTNLPRLAAHERLRSSADPSVGEDEGDCVPGSSVPLPTAVPLQCVSTPLSAAPSDTALGVPGSSGTSERRVRAEGSAERGCAFVADVSHFASHIVHFRVQAIGASGSCSAWSKSTCLLAPPSFRKHFPPPSPADPFLVAPAPLASDEEDAMGEALRLWDSSISGRGGALYFLGTKKGSDVTYVNPHAARLVRASMSSTVSPDVSQPERFVDYEATAYNYTGGSSTEQWMAVDLGEKTRLAVTHYALRTSQVNRLCQWEFQGKVNSSKDSAWVTLHRHTGGIRPAASSWTNGSGSSEDAFVEALFRTDGRSSSPAEAEANRVGEGDSSSEEVFQCFRILQTGANSGGGNHMFCSGVELYGTLYYGSSS